MTASRTIFWYLQFPFKWWAHIERRKSYARTAKRLAGQLVVAEALGDKWTANHLRERIARLKAWDKQEVANISRFHGIEVE